MPGWTNVGEFQALCHRGNNTQVPSSPETQNNASIKFELTFPS